MEKLVGYNNNNQTLKSQNKASKAKKKPIKIKYISSPMMVRANNASEFRAIVQELTGQNSNVTELSDDVANFNPMSGEYLGQSQTSWFPNSNNYYDLHQEEGDHYDQKLKVGEYYPSTQIMADIDHHHHDDHEHGFSTNLDDDHNGTSTQASFQAQFDQEGQFWRSDSSGFQYPCVFV